METRTGAFWPAPTQEHLLRAALLRGPAAVRAWETWSAQTALEALDTGSFRLLPLLYENLHAEGVAAPSMDKLKGIYRYHWSKNQVLFHQVAGVLDRLHAAGLQTLVLKGAALATLYYPNPGLRPMGDFDVLVPLHQAAAAAEVLAGAGWAPLLERPLRAFTPAYFSIRPGHGFRNAARQECDLHWHVFFQACWPEADAPFWQAARPLAFRGRATLALNPADQLLHLCTHCTLWNPVPSIRWVADAVWLLRAVSVEWDRLVAQARTLGLSLHALETLAYLRGQFEAPVPEAVLAQLRAAPVSNLERWAYRSWANPPDWRSAGAQLATQYRLYSAAGRGYWGLGHVGGALRFLQNLWGLDHRRHVPRVLWHKLGEWWRNRRLFSSG